MSLLVELRGQLGNPSSTLSSALRAYRQPESEVRSHTPWRHRPVTAQTRLSAVELLAAIAAYQAGDTLRQVRARFGGHRHTLSRQFHDRGVRLRGQPLTDDEAAEAIRLYQEGWSLVRVGRRLDREHSVIRDVLKRAGIPRRDSHGRVR